MIIDLEGVSEAVPLSLSVSTKLACGSCNAVGVFATLSLQSAHPSVLPTFHTSPSSVCLSSPFAHRIGRHQPSRQNCNSFPSSAPPFSLALPLFPSILRLRARLDCPTDRRRWTEERVRWILFLPAIMTFPWPSEMCPVPALWRCPPPSFSLHSYTRAAILGFTCTCGTCRYLRYNLY